MVFITYIEVKYISTIAQRLGKKKWKYTSTVVE